MESTKPYHLASLDGIARAVARAEESASYAGAFAYDEARVREFAAKAKSHCGAALAGLEAIGALLPGIETDAPVDTSIPLALLDTPAVRRLLGLLEEAAAAGAVVDRERGFVDADGEVVGMGETLAGLALRVRSECVGPAGLD